MRLRDGLPSSRTPLHERNATGPHLVTAATGGLQRVRLRTSAATLRRVRTVLCSLAVLFAAATACGAGAAVDTPIVFGLSGGNMAGYHVTIQPDGSVRLRGGSWKIRRQIQARQVSRLRTEIRNAHLTSRICAGSLPDFASEFIRLDGRTFTVRGGCEQRFQRVFGDLKSAVGLRR